MNTTYVLETLVQKYIPYAKMLSEIGKNAVYIVDKYGHYYFISDKFSLFGYDDIPEQGSDRVQDYPLTYRIHPDDLMLKNQIDAKIASFLSVLPKEEQTKYKCIYEYRGLAADGIYRRVIHQRQFLEVTEDNCLILGIIEVAPEQGDNLPVRVHMKHCVTGEIIPISIENENIPQLTPREKEVLILTCKGFSSKEIAQKLFISIYTANRHRQNIREKLRAGSMIEALNIARRKGII